MGKLLKTYRFLYKDSYPDPSSIIVKAYTLTRALKKIDFDKLQCLVCGYSDYKLIPQLYFDKTVDRVCQWHERSNIQ